MPDNDGIRINLPQVRGTIIPLPPLALGAFFWPSLFCCGLLLAISAINMGGLTPSVEQLAGGSASIIATNAPPVLKAGVVAPGKVLWNTGAQILSDAMANSPYVIVPKGDTANGTIQVAATPVVPQCTPVKSTPESLQALGLYRGIDINTEADLPAGADIEGALRLSGELVTKGCADLTAQWTFDKAKKVGTLINSIATAQSADQITKISNEVKAINPRVPLVYVAPRWVKIADYQSKPEGNVKDVFAGTQLIISSQASKGSLANLPDEGDSFNVVVKAPIKEVKDLNTVLTWGQLNELFGEVNTPDRALNRGAWKVDPSMTINVKGSAIVPLPMPKVAGPSDNDLAKYAPIATSAPAPTQATQPKSTATATQAVLNGTGGGGDNRTHVVQAGETLYAIARKYNVDPQTLIRFNNLSNANSIKPGQTIKIP